MVFVLPSLAFTNSPVGDPTRDKATWSWRSCEKHGSVSKIHSGNFQRLPLYLVNLVNGHHESEVNGKLKALELRGN